MFQKGRILDYAALGLGLERGHVRLAPFHEGWKKAYSKEVGLLSEHLGLKSFRLYHCGSTSIQGIHAKPIIDILGIVSSLVEFDAKKLQLEEIGYESKGEYGISGRRYCVLYNPQKTTAFVHLHVYQSGHPEAEKHLLFRDFLRANFSAAKEYEQEKIRLVDQVKLPRSQYTEAKEAIISSLLARAAYWAGNSALPWLVAGSLEA